MQCSIFINFNGQCRQALELYAAAFQTEIKNLMTFGEAPADPKMPIKESEKDRIMYAELLIGGLSIMFMDNSDDYPLHIGDNITPTIAGIPDETELRRLVDALKVGGKVHVEPTPMFFAPLYAMVEDQFGVIWQLMVGATE